MRHGFKKPKFGKGYDANRSLIRKLTVNFLMTGRVKTTLSRAKAVKPNIEKLVGKIKKMSEADRNVLLKKLGNLKAFESIFSDIRAALDGVASGYTKIVKLGRRDSDGAEMGELVWAHPVVKEIKKKAEPKKEAEVIKSQDKK